MVEHPLVQVCGETTLQLDNGNTVISWTVDFF